MVHKPTNMDPLRFGSSHSCFEAIIMAGLWETRTAASSSPPYDGDMTGYNGILMGISWGFNRV